MSSLTRIPISLGFIALVACGSSDTPEEDSQSKKAPSVEPGTALELIYYTIPG